MTRAGTVCRENKKFRARHRFFRVGMLAWRLSRMECPKCGFVMDPFVTECPRCARMKNEAPSTVTTRPNNAPVASNGVGGPSAGTSTVPMQRMAMRQAPPPQDTGGITLTTQPFSRTMSRDFSSAHGYRDDKDEFSGGCTYDEEQLCSRH